MKVWETKPDFIDTILFDLKDHFGIVHQRKGIHLTDCLLCLRKAYFDKADSLPPTEDELLYFLLGLGLQATFHSSMSAVPLIVEGVNLSPDFTSTRGTPVELKTTRIGRKRLDSFDFPKHWVRQLQGYCYGMKVTEGDLLIFTLIHPELLNYHIEFTSQEIGENWGKILGTADALKAALNYKILPPERGEDWECQSCRYRLRCATAKGEEG